MAALIVIAAVLLLVLLSPVSVEVRYREGEAEVVAHYLFLRYDLLKKRPEKKKKKETPKKEEPRSEEEPKKKEKENKLALLWRMVKASRRGLSILRRHLVFSRVRIFLRVGGEDAHQAAETFAKVSVAVGAALDVIKLAFVLRRYETAVVPDFLAPGLRADLRLRVGIRPLFVIMAGASILYRFVFGQKKTKKNLRIKGGKKHVSREASHQ